MLVSAQQQAGRQAGDKARQPAKKKQNHAKVTFIRKKTAWAPRAFRKPNPRANHPGARGRGRDGGDGRSIC
jgi:hypothetical protein